MSHYPEIPERLNIAALVVDRHVEEGRGDRVALHFGDESFSYQDLQRRMNAAGNALRELGIGRGDRFVIHSPNSLGSVVTFLGGLKIGSVPGWANSLLGVRELEYVVNNSEAKVIFTMGERTQPMLALRDRAPSVREVIALDDEPAGGALLFSDLVRGASQELETADTASDEPAFLVYTSGTTGEPKGVEHAHRWLVATGDPISEVLMELTPEDICFSPLEVSFIYALGCNLLYPLYAGAACAAIPGRFDPERMLAAIERLRPTILIAVPTLFRRLFALGDALDEYDLGSLRLGLSSGEPLPEETLRQARSRLGIEIYDCLGQTEMHIFMRPDPKRKFGSLGRPLPGHVVKVLDDDGEEAPTGEIGHLVIRADDPGLALGYRGRRDVWEQTQKNGWYYTNDLAYVDKDGFFWYVSRSDDLIKSRAYLISPSEIESVLTEHPSVMDAGVIGVPDEIMGERIRAYVILKERQDFSDDLVEDIQQSVRAKIAYFKVPKEILLVDSLPRTATGKLRRRALRERAVAALDSADPPPTSGPDGGGAAAAHP